jgi:hypothetical protein
MTFEKKERGQGLFYMDGSYGEPLINLKVGLKEKGHIFGQLCGGQVIPHYGPPGLSPSSQQLSISRVKEEEFNVPFFEHTQVKFQDKGQPPFFIPEAGTLGRDLMSELGIVIKVAKKNFESSLNLMTAKIESQV